MPRRVSLPGASELFRSTGTHDQHEELRIADPATAVASEPVEALSVVPDEPRRPAARTRSAPTQGSGRVRHDEKITVYVSSDELIALEETRLRLRADHGIALDRGRIVRQAISDALADFAANGASSELVRKLSAS